MTGSELVSHILAALGASGPAVGLLIGERAKRKTAEAQTTAHVAGAIKVAIDAALEGTKSTVQQAQSMAHEALEKARKCEGNHAEEKKGRAECEKRTKAVVTELEEIRKQLESSGAIVRKSDPERETPPEVVEAWAEAYEHLNGGAKS